MENLAFSNIKGVNEFAEPEALAEGEVTYFIDGILSRNGSG